MQQVLDSRIVSIAPMIDVTTTHFRTFMRTITKHAVLYTQMLHHQAVINNHKVLLPFTPDQHPIALQLGGCQPQRLAIAAKIAVEQYGYDQINLNVGCPSPRVQKGSFGACLMKQPKLVYECMQQIAKEVNVRCTVKCRLGVDEFDTYEFAKEFVRVVSGQGKGAVKHFIIHARKAILKGLSPTQNRNIPPLMYDRVYQLKKDFPQLTFEINGGIKTLKQGHEVIYDNNLEGVMIGRTAYQNTFELMRIDEMFYGDSPYHQKFKQDNDMEIRKMILLEYADYVEKLSKGQAFDQFGHQIKLANPSTLVKPLLNIYNGERNCAKFRQYLSDLPRLKKQPTQQMIRSAALYMQTIIVKKYNQQGKQIEQQNKKQEKQELQEVKTEV